jgi:hypothetical protein
MHPLDPEPEGAIHNPLPAFFYPERDLAIRVSEHGLGFYYRLPGAELVSLARQIMIIGCPSPHGCRKASHSPMWLA